MEKVIGHLGKAVNLTLILDWNLLIFEKSTIWTEE